MRRYELSNRLWDRLKRVLPHPTHHGGKGHPWKPHRDLINGILWILHTGAPWRDLPERYGPWETVFHRFHRWRQDGTWNRIVTSLLDELDDQGQIDHDLWCIDGSVIRASRAAAGAKKNASGPRQLGGQRRRKCKSRPTMRWDAPGAGSAPRSIWSATATVSSSPSISQPDKRMRAKRSSPRWLGASFTAA